MIYKNVEISIEEEELQAFIEEEKAKIGYTVHAFVEPFNGVSVKNPTHDINAKYYVLSYGDRLYLQKHIPYVGGYVPVLADNAEEVIGKHVEMILDNEVFGRFAVGGGAMM